MKKAISPILISTALISSCSSFNAQQEHPEDVITKSRYSKFSSFWSVDSEAKASIGLGQNPDEITASRRAKQLQLAWGRKRSIDMAYRDYVNVLYGDKKKFNIGSNAALNALAAFTALGQSVFVEKELQVFGALQTLIISSKSDVNKELFYERTIHLLIERMDALRAAAWAKVEIHLAQDNFQGAMGAIEAYAAAGSLFRAFNHLSKEDPTTGIAPSGGTSSETKAKALEAQQKILGL